MSIFQSPDQIVALRNLLQPESENRGNSDTDDDEPLVVNKEQVKKSEETSENNDGTSEESSGKNKAKKKASPYDKINASESDENVANSLPQNLEDWERLEEENSELLESRIRPEYTFTYCQAVGTEDIFLQMGNRTNATASCEDLLINIKLPNDPTPSEKMELNLSVNEIILSTSVHYLRLPLADLIDVDRCEAKFDREQEKLTLKLRLKREYDFINF